MNLILYSGVAMILVCTDEPHYGIVIIWASYWYILYFGSKTSAPQCEVKI